jgi:hypothetical protein
MLYRERVKAILVREPDFRYQPTDLSVGIRSKKKIPSPGRDG